MHHNHGYASGSTSASSYSMTPPGSSPYGVSPPSLRRPRGLELPEEIHPVLISRTLASIRVGSIDFQTRKPPVFPYDIGGDCATNQRIPHMRIVHHLLPSLPINVYASDPNFGVTISDAFAAIHNHLMSRIPDLSRLPPQHLRVVLEACNKRCQGWRIPPSPIFLDLLGGNTLFAGFSMDVSASNQLVGGIDKMQSRTWILVTTFPGR